MSTMISIKYQISFDIKFAKINFYYQYKKKNFSTIISKSKKIHQINPFLKSSKQKHNQTIHLRSKRSPCLVAHTQLGCECNTSISVPRAFKGIRCSGPPTKTSAGRSMETDDRRPTRRHQEKR